MEAQNYQYEKAEYKLITKRHVTLSASMLNISLVNI